MAPIQDLTTDFRMPADSFAGIFETPDEYYVAWGLGYEATAEGAPWVALNTCEHGVERFEDLESAEKYAVSVTSCYDDV